MAPFQSAVVYSPVLNLAVAGGLAAPELSYHMTDQVYAVSAVRFTPMGTFCETLEGTLPESHTVDPLVPESVTTM